MERDGEAVRFVANTLDQQQRGTVLRERDRLAAVAGEEQLLFLRDADGHEVREPERLERLVRRGQLPFAALTIGRRHDDKLVTAAQIWVADNYADPNPVTAMAEPPRNVGMNLPLV